MCFIKGRRQDSEPPPQQGGVGYNMQCPTNPCVVPGGGMGGMGGLGGNGGMGGMGGGNQSCPFAPCSMDQQAGGGGQYGQPQGMGMGNGMGMGMGMGGGMGMSGGMTPCLECGQIPNASCLPPGGQMIGRGSPGTPCVECGQIPNAPCLPGGSSQGQRASNVPCQECANLPDAPCASPAEEPEPEGDYQEIGATMGGNTLTIRVHKNVNKVEQMDPNAPNEPQDDGGNGCGCVMGHPGKKGKQQQQQAMSMRPGVQQGNENMPFAFKMGKSGDGGNNSVVVNPPVARTPDGKQFTEFTDPNKELYILRVGKKSEGPDKRQNLELELCTQKPMASLGPMKTTTDTQSDNCTCPKRNGNGNGNGKNGNGKNGNGNGKNGNGNGNGKNGNGNGKNGNGNGKSVSIAPAGGGCCCSAR